MSPLNSLKKIKKSIGSFIIFSFILQSAVPLIANRHTYKPLPQKQIQTSSTNLNNFVEDRNLNKLIKYIVEETDGDNFKNLSDPLKRCYKTLLKGTQVLPIEDVWQAMPDILQYVVDNQTKGPRPNAPVTASNAIVAPGTCDTAQLLELLVLIKNKIGCVTDDVCCNTILGILGNACEIFGPDESISSILIEILNTQTTCCNQTLTLLAIIEQDIQDAFTALEQIQETLEGCCGTFTTGIEALSEQLAECCESILDTQTIIIAKIDDINMDVDLIINEINECCEFLSEEILETQTILLECCSTFTTGIGDLSKQLAECCESILETQTIIIAKIDDINMDVDLIINEINECCEFLSEEILETQTILLECCSTFTAGIGDLSKQLAECCEQISDTQTTIIEKIDNVNIVINECCENLTECCENLTDITIDGQATIINGQTTIINGQTAIINGQTAIINGQTAIINGQTAILDAISTCCTQIEVDISATQDIINQCCGNLTGQITDLSDQLQECCESVGSEIFATQTIIITCCANLNDQIDEVSEQIAEVSGQLEECCDSLSSDIFDTQTIITGCCENLNEQIDGLSTQVEECCETINTGISNTQTIITECCESLSEQISEIAASPCAPTPISGPTTITQPGAYCLTQNIVGTITIDSDNVELDLNKFQIEQTDPSVAIVIDTQQNIRIKNGSLATTMGGTVGIFADGCTNIEITEINITGFNSGITITTSKGIRIDHTTITQTNVAMEFGECSYGEISNSQIFENNGAVGVTLFLNICQDFLLDNVQVNNNTSLLSVPTAYIIRTINCNKITFNNCTANDNTYTVANPIAITETRFIIFAFESSNDIICYKCQALRNESNVSVNDISFTGILYGFAATSVTPPLNASINTTFESCNSSNNLSTVTNSGTLGTTISIAIGFYPETAQSCTILSCIANHNTTAGGGGAAVDGFGEGIRTNGTVIPGALVKENITLTNSRYGIHDMFVGITPNTITKNISLGNLFTNYNGVGPGLIATYDRNGQTITNDLPWRNLDVVIGVP